MTKSTIDALCSIIRHSGISDSGAAGLASLHPSTVSRWKRDFPDFGILLRSAREEFRAAQMEVILLTARSGQSGGWRAAAWLLERTFPEDYSPRAQERARFREMHDAEWAGEEEGSEVAWPVGSAQPVLGDGEDAPTQEAALQNVKNSAAGAGPRSDGGSPSGSEPGSDGRGGGARDTREQVPSGRAGSPSRSRDGEPPSLLGEHAPASALQNVQNAKAVAAR